MTDQTAFQLPFAAFKVTLDGADLTDKVAPRLTALRLTDKRAGEADEVELSLHDTDGKLAIPKRGALIAVSLGWVRGSGLPIGMIDKGTFTVDSVSHSGPPDIITISARSADFTGDLATRRTGSYRQMTLGAIAQEVAGRHGLIAQVAPSLASIDVEVRAQTAKSDIAMLRELGRRYDAVATVKRGKLILAPIGAGTTAGGKTIPAATIVRADIERHRYSLASRDEYDGVQADYHDQAEAKRHSVTAGGSKRRKHLRRVFANRQDAQAAASAEHGRLQRGAAKLDLDFALGRPDLYPDRPVTVAGFKAEIDALSWLIVEAEHTMDAQGGLRTRLSLESAG